MNSSRDASFEAPAVKTLRVAAMAVLAVILALILTQALIAVLPPLRKVFVDALFGYNSSIHAAVKKAEWILALTVVVLAAAILLAVWKLGLSTWGRIAMGAAAIGAVLIYLAHDDPAIAKPITFDEFSPAFPGADESFKVLMRYGKQQAAAKNFKIPSFKDPYPAFVVRDRAKWKATILLHRAEIEQHWKDLAVERAWWNDLNGFDRIGDLTPPSFGSDIVAFQVFRTLSQHAAAVASLEAIDGHGDEAVETILPFLEVSRKLQPSSRTLVRTMVSVVIERMCLDTSAFILDTTTVSPAARGRLEGALGGGDAAAGARHMIGTDFVLRSNATRDFRAGDFVDVAGGTSERAALAHVLQFLSPFVYNPRATLNKVGEESAGLQEIVGARELGKLDAWTNKFVAEDARVRFKNPLGMLFLQYSTPGFGKVSENYWNTEDQRVALLARLKAT
jgi:hypothetical protein